MPSASIEPRLGQVAEILKGKEAGQHAVVVGIVDQKTLLLADGKKRPAALPKRKNIAHVLLLDLIDQPVAMELEQTGRVQDAKLRHCLNRYQKVLQNLEAEKKE